MLFGDSPESIVSENDDIDSEERAGIVRSELTSALICGELERRGKLYQRTAPSCVHCSIEWKLTVNGRSNTRDTEQDIVLAPSAY